MNKVAGFDPGKGSVETYLVIHVKSQTEHDSGSSCNGFLLLPRPPQVRLDTPERIVSAFCVVIKNGAEIGRTQAVVDSSDPLWAIGFCLPLPEASDIKIHLNSGNTARITTSLHETVPSGSEDFAKSPVLSLEVWDDDPRSAPVFLGRAKLPLRFMMKPPGANLSSSGPRKPQRDSRGDSLLLGLETREAHYVVLDLRRSREAGPGSITRYARSMHPAADIAGRLILSIEKTLNRSASTDQARFDLPRASHDRTKHSETLSPRTPLGGNGMVRGQVQDTSEGVSQVRSVAKARPCIAGYHVSPLH